jgi:hypothetical protein
MIRVGILCYDWGMENLIDVFGDEESKRLTDIANNAILYGYQIKDMDKENLLIAFG